MDVAIRGDRASCLSAQLAPRTWFFAVARGFGRVDGIAIERALLNRIRIECERRARSERFRRALDRPQAAAAGMAAVLARANADLHARTAAHADYVTASASFTGALIARNRAFIFHAGGTAAYLAHAGEITELSQDDAFDDGRLPVLLRGMGSSSALDVVVSDVALEPGDVIVLVGHRMRGDVDRRALLAHVEAAGPSEHVLVARFDCSDAASALREVASPARALAPVIARWLAGLGFVLALALLP